MTTKSLDFALRVKADLEQAAREVAEFDGLIKGLKASGQGAAQGLETASTAAAKNTAADQTNATAAKAAAAAQKALGAETQKTAAAQDRGAISSKQHALAMRQLPMQITDIVTGLASGQSPFMVLIQQGGQLKDSFGGIVPAGRALLGTLSPLVMVAAAGAAGFGAIALSIYQAQQQMDAFEVSLAKSGASATTTAGELADMADRLDASTTATAGHAAEVIAQVVATGQFSKEQIELVTAAALQAEAANIQSIDETIAAFTKLGKDPVEAILALNEAQHFLSDETLAQIRTFVEQGRTADATALAFATYAGVIEDRSGQVTQNLGLIEGALRGIKHASSEAWDNIVTGMRNADREASEGLRGLADLWGRLRMGGVAGAWSLASGGFGGNGASAAATPKTVDSKQDKKEQEEKKKRDQERKQFFAEESRYLSEAARKTKELAAVDDLRTRGVISQQEAIKRKNEIEESYARKGSKKKAGKTDAQQDEEAAKRELENLQKQIALTATLAEGEKQVSNEARVAYEIKSGAYRLSSAATQQALLAAAKERDAQLEAAEAAEKKKKADEDAKKAYERLKDELRTPAEVALDEVTAKVQVLNDQLTRGKIDAAEYKAQLARIFKQSETKAPELPGQFQSYGGPIGDAADLAAYSAQLETWRANEIAKWDGFYARREISEQEHQERLKNVQEEYGAKQAAYSQAQSQFMLSTAASVFGSLAEIARNGAGEQSKTYRALFALSQGFAVAQALIAVYQNAAEASKKAGGYPYNIPIIAGAIAQGLAIVAQIRAVQPAAAYATGGRIVGPGTPTSDSVPIWASRDEHMIRAASATQPGARAFLDDFNERGMPALYDWARAGAFADGGAITAMPEPRARLASPSAVASPVRNDMSVAFFSDREALRQYVMNHPKSREVIVLEASENGNAISHSWQTGG